MENYEVKIINNKSYANYVNNAGNGGYEYVVFNTIGETKEEVKARYEEEGYTVYVRTYEEAEKAKAVELANRISYLELELESLKAELKKIRKKNEGRG